MSEELDKIIFEHAVLSGLEIKIALSNLPTTHQKVLLDSISDKIRHNNRLLGIKERLE